MVNVAIAVLIQTAEVNRISGIDAFAVLLLVQTVFQHIFTVCSKAFLFQPVLGFFPFGLVFLLPPHDLIALVTAFLQIPADFQIYLIRRTVCPNHGVIYFAELGNRTVNDRHRRQFVICNRRQQQTFFLRQFDAVLAEVVSGLFAGLVILQTFCQIRIELIKGFQRQINKLAAGQLFKNFPIILRYSFFA